jgi:hypothetical protein
MVRNQLEDAVTAATTTEWWEPEVLPNGGQPLTPAQISRWLTDGFLVVSNLWPPELVRAIIDECVCHHDAVLKFYRINTKFSMSSTSPHF